MHSPCLILNLMISPYSSFIALYYSNYSSSDTYLTLKIICFFVITISITAYFQFIALFESSIGMNIGHKHELAPNFYTVRLNVA